jgi:hypothetical protein
MDTCSAVMLSGHKPHVADAVIEAVPRLSMFSVTQCGVARVRLRGNPVCMLSKNFLATHQLDVVFWTELLCRFCQLYCSSRRVSIKRALTVYLESSIVMTIPRWNRCCRQSAVGAGKMVLS